MKLNANNLAINQNIMKYAKFMIKPKTRAATLVYRVFHKFG